MEVEVELGGVDPVGVVEAERHLGKAPAERKQQMEPASDQIAHGLKRQLTSRRARRITDREGAYVGVVSVILRASIWVSRLVSWRN